jgi:methionyl-tRNA formyltransferase
MTPSANPSVGVVGTKVYTHDCIQQLTDADHSVDFLVTLTPEQGANQSVAGYEDLRELAAETETEVYHPETYSLDSEQDIQRITDLDLDLLLVAGWSRLVPEAILESLSIGALGAHGSPEGLPKGRGRAVLNWALIKGEREFNISTFFLTPGIDSGDIIETTTFEITDYDTASTLRYKTWWAFTAAIIEHFDDIVSGEVETIPQTGEPTYYPKREPQDGAIDWTRTAEQIHAFVRALTEPYPGAFTFLDGEKVPIWRAEPFASKLDFGAESPGTVLKVFCDDEILVATGHDPILLKEYEGITSDELGTGAQFESHDHEAILDEIRTRYPPSVADEQKEI